MKSSNAHISDLLKSVAASKTLSKDNFFEIRAYNSAADAIEHSTAEIKDLWQEGKLSDIPGVGKSIQGYLDEYFKTGEVKHFETILSKHPAVIYDLIKIPGIGPATAVDLAGKGIESLKDLEEKVQSGELVNAGVGEKTVEKIFDQTLRAKTHSQSHHTGRTQNRCDGNTQLTECQHACHQ